MKMYQVTADVCFWDWGPEKLVPQTVTHGPFSSRELAEQCVLELVKQSLVLGQDANCSIILWMVLKTTITEVE